ncbi:MAG: MATE family efflux transporter [Oscillospiraceae bacterium]|nr:MATE family efflux transporter [Oscillospiraceae bacterium]
MKRHSMDLTTGPVARQLLAFGLPLIINAAINLLYGIVDKSMLGIYVGDAAMAAASVSNSPFNLIYNLFSGVAVGALVCCGNYLGADDRGNLRRCMHTAMSTGFLLGLVVLIVGLPLSRPVLVALGTPEELLSDALLYFRIRFAGCPVTMLNAFTVSIMNAHGDTKRITLLGIGSGLLNVVLNFVFLLVIKLGVAGVALATLLSGLANLICKLAIMFSPKGEYQLRVSKLLPDFKHMGRLLAVGIPNGLNSAVFSFSNVLLQSTVNSFGTAVIAGSSAADSVIAISGLAYQGIPAATVATLSQCCGARNYDRIREVVRKALLVCHVFVDSMCVVCLIFAQPLLGLFTQSPEVVEAGTIKLIFYCGGYFIHNFGQIYVAAIKGLRRSTAAFLVNVFSVCVPRVLWVWFVVPLVPTPAMLYLIYPISWLISAAMLGITYHSCYRKCLRSAQEQMA